MKHFIIIAIISTTIISCSYLATTFTSSKQITTQQAGLASEANKYFWDNYHQANYDSIPKIIELLNRALQENPNDLIITAHLGFVHIWALSERQRNNSMNASITEHILLSRRYFDESNKMNPHDPRILGFLADMTLIEGKQFNNKKEQTAGYFLGLKAIRKWPQFNKFTLGYVFSALEKTDKNFQMGLTWQYETIDDCACEKNTRKTDYKLTVQKIKKSTDPKIYRVCWNTWIAPHNWEGFCMNWGDMLIKNGEVKEGLKIYNLAKESDTYNEWPFNAELETRIKNATRNVVDFNKPLDNAMLSNQNVIMFNSKMACTGCHQMSKNEFLKLGYQNLHEKYYFLNK